MRRPITKIGVDTIEVNGLKVHSWTKKCPNCHKEYTTTSRTQKFCSDKCRVSYNKKVKEDRKRYKEVAPIERIRVRSHALAVSILAQLVEMGVRDYKCAKCGCTEKLEVHHNDLNFLNNTPANLTYLCTSCHSKVHSELETTLIKRGVLLSEYYESSVLPFFEALNKNSKRD